MAEELDKRAEAYMRSVMSNDGDVFTRADLYEYIKEAWKAGYAECESNIAMTDELRKKQDECLELLRASDDTERKAMMDKLSKYLLDTADNIPEVYAEYIKQNETLIRLRLARPKVVLKMSNDGQRGIKGINECFESKTDK